MRTTSELNNLDVLSIGINSTKEGKKMYFGKSRQSEIYSIGLDNTGDFVGEPKLEIRLTDFNGGLNEFAHRIRFNRNNQMTVKAVEFNYNLASVSDSKRNLYTFEYNQSSKDWKYIAMQK